MRQIRITFGNLFLCYFIIIIIIIMNRSKWSALFLDFRSPEDGCQKVWLTSELQVKWPSTATATTSSKRPQNHNFHLVVVVVCLYFTCPNRKSCCCCCYLGKVSGFCLTKRARNDKEKPLTKVMRGEQQANSQWLKSRTIIISCLSIV